VTDLTADLEQLGARLHAAVQRDRRRRIGRPNRRGLILVAAALIVLLGVGASVAATVWPTPTPGAESDGMIASDAVFANEHPQCTQVAAAKFTCALATTPTGLVVEGSYEGTKVATVDAQKHVNGGCVATSADGRRWDCFIGEAAVRHGIVDQSYLGAYRPDLGHG
jgi:hypothetical protein